MIKIRIATDIDECLNDMLAKILPLYNEKYGDDLHYREFTKYNVDAFIKPECNNLFEEFANDDLIASTVPAPDSVDVLSELAKRHDIYFVTAGHPYTAKARDIWLGHHFPFYQSRNLIMCREKQLLDMDVLIDDYEMNLIGGRYKKFLISKPWNKEFATSLFGITRVYGFAEIPKYIRDMEHRY